MKNPFVKEEVNPIVPLLIGVAIGGVLALLLAPESGSDTRESIIESAKKGWDAIKENIPVSADDITAIKDKVMDSVRSKMPEEVNQSEPQHA